MPPIASRDALDIAAVDAATPPTLRASSVIPPSSNPFTFGTFPPIPLLKRMETSGGNGQAVADEATACEVESPVDEATVAVLGLPDDDT